MPIIRFEPVGVEGVARAGESLFVVARRLGVPIATACTGNGNCGLCWVTIEEGDAAITPRTHVERRAHRPPGLGGGWALPRLACQAVILGAGPSELLTVRIPRLFVRSLP